MSEAPRPQILIVGAGSMGLVVGYHLYLAGSDVTYLVRPHRSKQLDRPQLLYSYDDKKLKEFKQYSYVTDPSKIADAKYDYIVVTLDGASLRSETGEALVKSIGEYARGTDTKIILGSVFINILPWFLETSALPANQVTNGALMIHSYPTTAKHLVESSQQDLEVMSKADQAYTDCPGSGILLADSSPTVAEAFAKLYNASGVSQATIKHAEELACSINSIFPVFAAAELMGWPKFKDVDAENEVWKLAVAGVKEIQGLGIHGAAGQQAVTTTTESTYLGMLIGLEQMLLQFDLQGFNRFHHGGKVNVQDRQLMQECIHLGESEGKPMSALKELLERV